MADVGDPGFVAEAHRQAMAVTASEHGADDQAFINALSRDLKRSAWVGPAPVLAYMTPEYRRSIRWNGSLRHAIAASPTGLQEAI